MDSTPALTASPRQFPCKQCGASLQFAPGTQALRCPYCGTTNQIDALDGSVGELDFNAYLKDAQNLQEQVTVRCDTCGAETSLDPHVTAGRCPFCGAGIVAQGTSKKLIKPKSLLPFHIARDQAARSFCDWIASRWFAPNELARRAQASQIAGVYIPAWTYDANTTSNYTGQRGDDYWETQTFTTRVNGRMTTQTRQIRKTRWRSASGIVHDQFDDILILASQSLPAGYAEALEPWDLPALVPYRDEYLSGFVAESYQIGLPEGFEQSKQVMADYIEQTIRRDIGGDHQRIASVDTRYFDVTFKHILLPVWISAYRYHDRTFRFLINARTGEVQGERPYSWAKITLAALGAVGAIVTLLLLLQR